MMNNETKSTKPTEITSTNPQTSTPNTLPPSNLPSSENVNHKESYVATISKKASGVSRLLVSCILSTIGITHTLSIAESLAGGNLQETLCKLFLTHFGKKFKKKPSFFLKNIDEFNATGQKNLNIGIKNRLESFTSIICARGILLGPFVFLYFEIKYQNELQLIRTPRTLNTNNNTNSNPSTISDYTSLNTDNHGSSSKSDNNMLGE